MGRLASLLLLAFALLAAPAPAEPFTATSFDGTRINANFFAAEGLKAGERAPTVLYGPGYSSGGDTNPESESSEATGAVGVGPLRRAGYNVVTWDPRGFGRSGGTVQIDSPEHEARDVQAIIDVIAKRAAVLLDAPGDPRLGMTGVSYGGGIQFNTAQREPRIDVIAPAIAWNSLITSLFRDQSLKAGWGLVLCGAGEGRGLAEGIFVGQMGGHDPVVTRTCVNGIANGTPPSREDQDWFAARGPARLIERIRIPTFIVQGTVDTLFTLQEAIDNHAILRGNGVPLKMMWFCGGHGACTTGAGEKGMVEKRVIAWLDRHLRGRSVDTGPAFEWIVDSGTWRSAAGFPLPESARLTGTGSGTLPLEPAQNSGALVAATPAPPGGSVEVVMDPVGAESDVLGVPTLKMTYSGSGSSATTHVWAQVVDVQRGVVAGNVVTPIPVTLDGKEHTVERPLEPIALRAPAGKRYRIQIVPSTTVYAPQRTAGALTIRSAQATLPVVNAAAAAPSRAETRGRTRRGRCTGARAGFRKVTLRARGRGLAFRVLRHRAAPWRVELLRAGRRVASIPRRPGSFVWRGRSSLEPGTYAVRLTLVLRGGAKDVRQATVRYRGGRFGVGRLRARGSC